MFWWKVAAVLAAALIDLGCSSAEADVAPAPAPSPKGFGAPCAKAADCVSGLCSQAGTCTQACTTHCDCPSSYGCGSQATCEFGAGVCSPDAGSPDAGGPPPPPPDAGPPPATAIDLSFDPTNLGSWVDGKSLTEVSDLRGGGNECGAIYLDTDKGTAECFNNGYGHELDVHFEVFTQGGGIDIAETVGVFFVRSLAVQSSYGLHVVGSRPGVVVAQETIEVAGLVQPEAGAWPSAPKGAVGEGPGGGGYSAASFGGGGEGAGHCSLGGLGAEMTVHVGKIYGSPAVAPLLGGSSGGAPNSTISAPSGAGGAALQLIAGKSITVTAAGALDVTGGNGGGLAEGSGGGSGGSILLEAPTVTINGTLKANGGAGGVAINGVRAKGAQGSSPAQDGQEDLGVYSDFGGGGGGFGRIRINTESGTASIAIDSVVSPSPSTSCMTQGKLAPKTGSSPPPPPCSATPSAPNDCDICTGEHCCAEFSSCVADALCNQCITAQSPGPACITDPKKLSYVACMTQWCPAICKDEISRL